MFNLALGDWNEEAIALLDMARSNNKDKDKVLATVAFTIFEFMEHHPGATVIAYGATPSRTRLYQMGIRTRWKEISIFFSVQGLVNGSWFDFETNKNYEAFTVKAK